MVSQLRMLLLKILHHLLIHAFFVVVLVVVAVALEFAHRTLLICFYELNFHVIILTDRIQSCSFAMLSAYHAFCFSASDHFHTFKELH